MYVHNCLSLARWLLVCMHAFLQWCFCVSSESPFEAQGGKHQDPVAAPAMWGGLAHHSGLREPSWFSGLIGGKGPSDLNSVLPPNRSKS